MIIISIGSHIEHKSSTAKTKTKQNMTSFPFEIDSECDEYAKAVLVGDTKYIDKICDTFMESGFQIGWVTLLLDMVANEESLVSSIRYEAAVYYYYLQKNTLNYDLNFRPAVDLGNCKKLCRLGLDIDLRSTYGVHRKVNPDDQPDYDDVIAYILK